jgi:predicted TIM-barrel enzyme
MPARASSPRYSRDEILGRLRAEVAAGKTILGAGCSAGIIAKCAEIGGADLIITYSTGRTRMMGLPTTTITGPASNHTTLAMAAELLNVIQDTPLIAGVEANDFEFLDLEASLDRFTEKGFSGIINFPTTGLNESLVAGGLAAREHTGAMAAGFRQEHWGWSREVEMIARARARNLFTMTYVCSPDDAAQMAQAGADAVCAHVGGTIGGMTGFRPRGETSTLLERAQRILDAATAVSPEIIPLVHGGPFHDPASTGIIYRETSAVGFVAASAVERIPVENAIREVCEQYKNLKRP